MASNLPSGYDKSKEKSKKVSSKKTNSHPSMLSSNSNSIAFLALILAVISLFISVFASGGISSNEKSELANIAKSLREIQQKEIVLTSPLKTTVVVDESFPISEILPKEFTLYVDDVLAIDSQLTGRSSSGQLLTFNIVDDLKISSEIPIDSKRSLAGMNVNINRQIPIETRFSATLRVNAVYGKELNDIINRLEAMAD